MLRLGRPSLLRHLGPFRPQAPTPCRLGSLKRPLTRGYNQQIDPQVGSVNLAYIIPTLASGAFIGSAFVYASVKYNDRVHSTAATIQSRLGQIRARLEDMTRMQAGIDRVSVDRTLRWIETSGLPTPFRNVATEVAIQWSRLSQSQKTIGVLIGVNTLVFAMWRIPRLEGFMYRHFTHSPASGRTYTLLTSVFSHAEPWHFGVNMVGLYSFGIPVHKILGMEQFLAFYFSSGIFSGLMSHYFKIFLRHSRPVVPSLGASGALFGLLGASAVLFPAASVSLIFLPMIPIAIGYAVPAFMAMDTAGLLLGWRSFDHMAHLSGALSGYVYGTWGQEWWDAFQRKLERARTYMERRRRS